MVIAGVDTSGFQHADQLAGDSAEDTALLAELYVTAKGYISAFSWAPAISQVYFADGVGGIFGLFFFVFETPIQGEDEALWVVTGDLPSAYFVTDQASTPSEALGAYCTLMEEWANAVIAYSDLKDVYPVHAPATQGNAKNLLSRIEFIRREFV